MRRTGTLWMMGAAFLGTTLYALAEELILTTYYPSPRGVYNELRVGSGSISSPTAKLQVILPTVETGLAVRVDDQNPTDSTPFVINKDGDVGIGTAGPEGKLNVRHDVATDRPNQLQLQGVANGNLKFMLGVNTTDKYAALSFVEEGVAWRNVILAAPGGNVGIGTTGPANKLHVAGSGTGTNMARILVSSSDNQAGIGFFSDGIGTSETVIYSPDATDELRFYLNGSDRMTIKTDGNVGIGMTSPDQKLDINGQVKIRGGSPAAGKVLVSDLDGDASWAGSLSLPDNPSNCTGTYDFAKGVSGTLAAECATEGDPQVGTVTSGKLCRGDGSAVQCDQSMGLVTYVRVGANGDGVYCNSGDVALGGGARNNAGSKDVHNSYPLTGGGASADWSVPNGWYCQVEDPGNCYVICADL